MPKKNAIKVETKKEVKKAGQSVMKEAIKEVADTTKKAKVNVENKKTTVKPVEKKETTTKTIKTEEKLVKVKKAVNEKAVSEKTEVKKAVKAKPVKKEVKAATVKSVAKTLKEDTATVEKPTKAVTKSNAKVVSKTKEKAETKPVAKKTTRTTKATKATTKTDVKKTAPKKATIKKQDISKYDDISLDACIEKMHVMKIGYDYADYCNMLMNEADLSVLEKNIIDGNQLVSENYDFAKDGYDIDIVMATLVKVVDTMDISAADFKTIKKDMDACIKTKLIVDADENAKNYLAELKVAEKVLMVGQRKNITTAEEATTLLKSDVRKFFEHFKNVAYTVLKNWKYEDVEFYQEFAFAFVSQYTDMFADYQNEIQMDCADLYILHGDEGRGDHEYNYVLRENAIKDYIYYRFANVYVERNLDKAKSIANSSFQWIDDRFDYFKKIVEIIEK